MTTLLPHGSPPAGGSAGGGRRGPLRRLREVLVGYPLALVALVALAAVVWWAVASRQHPHHLRAAFSSAVSIRSGLRVAVDGIEAGKVTSISYEDGQAVVGLGLDDGYWPMHKGTTASIRFGTTLGNGTREIDLNPGPKSAPVLGEDGIIPIRDTSTPVEFDQLFGTFDKRTRQHLQGTLANTRTALKGQAGRINDAIPTLAPGFSAIGGVASDLVSDEHALRTLIANGNRATVILGQRQNEISNLVAVAARTFDVFARNTRAVQDSLDEAAPTLAQTRTTLARLETSVGVLTGLVNSVRPGAARLTSFLKDAQPAVHQLARLAPQATATVRELRSSGPRITKLLDTGTPFLGRVRAMGTGLAPQVACIRPYAPEIAGFFSNWASFPQGYDYHGHLARIRANEGPSSFTSTPSIDTDTFLKATGGVMSYAMPRPPGLNAGKPWYLPECGAGPSSTDPSKDPEDSYHPTGTTPSNDVDSETPANHPGGG